ncbi:alpha/beta fold hydrolase [Microlunatus elymi]|uniref:Alpha/beta fold hydrolase n=1 Tax=Microlunatus elymi TaxID=2596828 RepID=A0A516Q0T2_9ACTN|nr:alpha/beta fold hydrolase [Microlunatus elymi]QDP97039.1 alpha/beta fold hydrolase [Microlunatus elymi]
MAGALRQGLYATVLDQHPEGGRPRIAFCHGLFGQGKNWTTVAKQLSDDYAVTLIDMPNHGRSDWTDELSYPALADRLAGFLADADGGEKWNVVGHSMGGKIAMALALRHPDLVQRLCVVDIAPVDYRGKSEFDRYADAMRSVDLDQLRSRSEADDQLRSAVPDPTVRGFLLQNLRRSAGGSHHAGWHWQMNLRLLGDQLDRLTDWPDPFPGRGNVLPSYPGPTLWVAGADSDYIKPEYAPAMKGLFPRVRSIKIKSARHWVHSEQPEIFVQVLRRFLDQPAS